MSIVVIGSTGLVGSKLVTKLGADGHEMVRGRNWKFWTDPSRHFAWEAPSAASIGILRQDSRRRHGLQGIPLRRQIIQETRT